MTSAIQGDDGLGRVYEKEVFEAEEVAVGKQEAADKTLLDSQQDIVNPFARLENAKKSIKTQTPRIKKMIESKGVAILDIEKLKDSAEQFSQGRNNPELKSGALVELRKQIKEGDTKEEILNTLVKFYKDPSLADEALDFLLQEITEGPLAETVKAAKTEFTATYRTQITAGRNIQAQARAASDKGLGTPTDLRATYSEFTQQGADSVTLFQQLTKTYTNYEDTEKMIKFLLHSLGADMKPPMGADMKPMPSSIPREKLQNLITETKNCQAIFGIYKFFSMRMLLIEKQFKKQGLPIPPQLSFETIAKQFMTLASDRSPSALKVSQLSAKLGIEHSIPAQIIVFSQMRDSVHNVALRIFKSSPYREDAANNRDNCRDAIIACLETLEDALEDLQEKKMKEEEG